MYNIQRNSIIRTQNYLTRTWLFFKLLHILLPAS